jgi:hypothetical protein
MSPAGLILNRLAERVGLCACSASLASARNQRRQTALSFGAPMRASSNPVGSSTHPHRPMKKRGHKGPISSSTGGEGGIRTHEYLVRYYWNSSPAPSTTRPPLRNLATTGERPVQRPVLALHRKARIPRSTRDRRSEGPGRLPEANAGGNRPDYPAAGALGGL